MGTSHSAHVCRTCACAVHAVWRDARFRSISPSSRAMNAQGTVCPAMIAEARAFPRNQCTPVYAFLSRRSDRRPLFPSQSSLSLTANTSQPVSSPHKTLLLPLLDLNSTNIHHTPTPHPRLTFPTSQTHSLTPRTNQTTTLQSSTWAR
jgi:hypothetical protein